MSEPTIYARSNNNLYEQLYIDRDSARYNHLWRSADNTPASRITQANAANPSSPTTTKRRKRICQKATNLLRKIGKTPKTLAQKLHQKASARHCQKVEDMGETPWDSTRSRPASTESPPSSERTFYTADSPDIHSANTVNRNNTDDNISNNSTSNNSAPNNNHHDDNSSDSGSTDSGSSDSFYTLTSTQTPPCPPAKKILDFTLPDKLMKQLGEQIEALTKLTEGLDNIDTDATFTKIAPADATPTNRIPKETIPTETAPTEKMDRLLMQKA